MSKEECCTCSDRLNYVKLCEKYDQLESVHKVLVEDNLTYENQIADLEAKLAESEKNVELYKKEKCLARPDSKPFVRLEDYQRLEQQLAEKNKEYQSFKKIADENVNYLKNRILEETRNYNQAKISFAVEQLEKVKDFCDGMKWAMVHLTKENTQTIQTVLDEIDNQIKAIKGDIQ